MEHTRLGMDFMKCFLTQPIVLLRTTPLGWVKLLGFNLFFFFFIDLIKNCAFIQPFKFIKLNFLTNTKINKHSKF